MTPKHNLTQNGKKPDAGNRYRNLSKYTKTHQYHTVGATEAVGNPSIYVNLCFDVDHFIFLLFFINFGWASEPIVDIVGQSLFGPQT